MGAKFDRYFVPAVIGFAPLVLLLLTWAPNGKTGFQTLAQAFYLPLIVAELFIVFVALREGALRVMRRWSWHWLPTSALLILIAVAVVTAITAPNPAAARIWTFYWLVHLLVGLSVAYLCTARVGARDLVRAYVAGFVAFVGGAVIFAALVTNPAFDWTHAWPAVTHIRHFGYYAAAVAGLCIGVAATERRPRVLGILFVLGVICFGFALWTGSRGAVVAIAGALLIGTTLIPAMRRIVVWVGTALSLALGALFASFGPAHGDLMGFGRTITQTVGSGDVSTGRTQLWLNVIGAIRHRPFFGYGENQMSTVAPFGDLGQTHEIVLQILLAWGVVGLACVAVLAIWFLVRSLPLIGRSEAGMIPPFMAMLTLACLATFDGALFHVLPVSIFAACAGMIAANWPERAAKQ